MRARCGNCGHRFPWPAGLLPSALDVRQRLVACPACQAVGPLAEEPPDEVWWAWTQGVRQNVGDKGRGAPHMGHEARPRLPPLTRPKVTAGKGRPPPVYEMEVRDDGR